MYMYFFKLLTEIDRKRIRQNTGIALESQFVYFNVTLFYRILIQITLILCINCACDFKDSKTTLTERRHSVNITSEDPGSCKLRLHYSVVLKQIYWKEKQEAHEFVHANLFRCYKNIQFKIQIIYCKVMYYLHKIHRFLYVTQVHVYQCAI